MPRTVAEAADYAVVQEEVMRSMIKEKNELKEDSDGLKKEIHVVKR